MELKLQDRERELHALQIDNEAVCVKLLSMDFLYVFMLVMYIGVFSFLSFE